jgi:hypothetical protein
MMKKHHTIHISILVSRKINSDFFFVISGVKFGPRALSSSQRQCEGQQRQIISTSKRTTITHQLYYNYSSSDQVVFYVEGNAIGRTCPLKIILPFSHNTTPFSTTHSKGV